MPGGQVQKINEGTQPTRLRVLPPTLTWPPDSFTHEVLISGVNNWWGKGSNPVGSTVSKPDDEPAGLLSWATLSKPYVPGDSGPWVEPWGWAGQHADHCLPGHRWYYRANSSTHWRILTNSWHNKTTKRRLEDMSISYFIAHNICEKFNKQF